MNKKKRKTVGILNEGEENAFINNEFEGFDIGIHDKGKRTFASGNKFFRKVGNKLFWKQFWIHIVLGGILVGVVVHFLTK